MAIILNIETATKNCSVAIGKDGALIALQEESASQFIHAEKLHEFINAVLSEASITTNDLDAVAVSHGPGSYTGLRIGVSAAKGLCYALDIPLIALDTTAVLAQGVQSSDENAVIISALDARRNEAYVQAFDATYQKLSEIVALEIESDSLGEYEQNELIVVGDAAQKVAELVDRKVEFHQQFPSARDMVSLSEAAYLKADFANVAYHEPFYLKDFIAGKPKKML